MTSYIVKFRHILNFNCLSSNVLHLSVLEKIFISSPFLLFIIILFPSATSLVSSFLSSSRWIHFQEGLDGLSLTLGIAAATGLGALAYTEVILDKPFGKPKICFSFSFYLKFVAQLVS